MKHLLFRRFIAVCLTLFILLMQISGTEIFAKEYKSEVDTTAVNTYEESDSSQESSSEASSLESGTSQETSSEESSLESDTSQEEVPQTFCEEFLYQSGGAGLEVAQIGNQKC